jgi:diguanylate cyclase (GGDEF)-like protein/PAS domain S-box-containing protein
MRPLEPLPFESGAIPAPGRSIEAAQRVELLDIAAHDGVRLGLVTICLIGFVNLLLREVTLPGARDVWLITMTLTTIAVFVVSRLWKRRRSMEARSLPSDARLRSWERAHAIVALCSGIAWGTLVATTADIEHTALPVVLALTAALLLSNTSYALGPLAQWAFAAPIVVAQEIDLIRFAVAHQDLHYGLLPIAWLVLFAVLYSMQRSASLVLRSTVATRIEKERAAAEQAALLENAPLGILVVRSGRIVSCNDALLKVFGYTSKSDLIGASTRVLMPDDDAWLESTRHADLAIEGSATPRVVRRRRADGSVIDVMLKIAAMTSVTGEREFIGIYEDFQDRLTTEETYRHAVRMQRLVFEYAGEGIAIVNDGIIEQANQALSDLVGLSTMQLTDRPLHTIFEDPREWSEIEKHFQRIGNTIKLERKILHQDGRAIWANVTGCLVDAPPDPRVVDIARASDKPVDAVGKRSIWILADLSVQKHKEAENWYHANHDVMTSLPNRRFLQDRLDQALAFARRDGRRVAIVELDLDGFKSVNDLHGHRFGDAVLEEVARRLSTVVRELDTVGRWGGDEFVLVLKEIESREVVEEMVKRVITTLAEPIIFMGHHLIVGSSIGIALYPDHGEDVEALMLAADLAMYESKGAGGSTWRFALPAVLAPRGKYRSAPTQPLIADH